MSPIARGVSPAGSAFLKMPCGFVFAGAPPRAARRLERAPRASAARPRGPPSQRPWPESRPRPSTRRARLSVGDTVPGVVTRLERYGAFVLLDGLGVEALVHISELSDRYVADVAAEVRVGERLMVRVLPPDGHGRVKLSVKSAELTGRALRVRLGGDPGDAWNADGETVWADLGERSAKTHMPWEGDPALFTFDHSTLPPPPPRHPPYPKRPRA